MLPKLIKLCGTQSASKGSCSHRVLTISNSACICEVCTHPLNWNCVLSKSMFPFITVVQSSVW